MLTAAVERPAGGRPVLQHPDQPGRTIRAKTSGQKDYVDAIDRHTVMFGIGPAGTGKTYLAMAKAVQALQASRCTRIMLTRPAVEAGERLGFLPGTLSDKIDPYLRPLYDALHDMVDPESIPRLMEAGTIEVAPLAYMRGRTLNDAFIILDEAQNTTPEQMKMFLTRLGFGSKIVVTGDITQVDLPGDTRIGPAGRAQILAGVDDVRVLLSRRARRRPAPAGQRDHRRVCRWDERDAGSRRARRAHRAGRRARSTHEHRGQQRVRRRGRRGGVRRAGRYVLDAMHVHPKTELSIVLVDADAMDGLHVQWMDEPGPTDVLAFPMDELAPGHARATRDARSALLGDVVLCPEVAAQQARTAGHSTAEELLLLTTHGILHLLGYDHAEPEEEKEMFALQRQLLLTFLASAMTDVPVALLVLVAALALIAAAAALSAGEVRGVARGCPSWSRRAAPRPADRCVR